jgi:hypothetical protein
MKKLFFALLVVVLLAACSPVNTDPVATPWLDNPYAPQSGDSQLVVDTVRMVNTEILTMESNPPQFSLKLSFFTPTACQQYRVTVDRPDANGRIVVSVYSLRKENQPCNLMQLATPTEVSLNLGSFSNGHYTVWVNGVQVAEFDA